ncbi:MAG: sigma 54-interacting transcriptional regulator [Nitrospinota bacterium]|nr:sigma 54-interacting transcriptional regulator [Nitrospinota bacterium]
MPVNIKKLAMLSSVSRVIDASTDRREALNAVLNVLADYMQMERVTLTLLDRETSEVIIEGAYGLSMEEQVEGKYKLGEGVTGRVIETGNPMIVPRISEEPLFLNRTGVIKGEADEERSFICVPVKFEGESIGALSGSRPFSKEVFVEGDLNVLSIVASLISQAVRTQQVGFEKGRLKSQKKDDSAQSTPKANFRPKNIIGNSKVMLQVYGLIPQVSHSNTTVLILGESGTGKELAAQAIHENSPRKDKAFIKLNCAALPETIIESELFGHEKGAFTGAHERRKGRFELADGGTIFLDEIGDIPPATQVKLLRVLQEREFERVGGGETIKCDVRIITATNQDLELLIDKGIFRQDLYYRLNVFPLYMPPLRKRETDVLLIADYFVGKYSRANKRNIYCISTQAADMLMSYKWPGNVRELENCIERAVLLCNEGIIYGHHLPLTLQTIKIDEMRKVGCLDDTISNIEREMIIDALKTSHGNMAKAARKLGITERIMGLRVSKHGIKAKQYREPEAS